MKIAIAREGDNIITVKDYDDVLDTGEIAHFLAELEIIKFDLLQLYDESNKLT
ncbi:hypothetical protein LCGC14_1482450 [marine sediment metagenome]|uniref:Uncharacterized protein n=1 Tax=marine sediment metagenome TaxID=412755 RepID=A0A0F9J969_9ZZZZ